MYMFIVAYGLDLQTNFSIKFFIIQCHFDYEQWEFNFLTRFQKKE